ncbi:D-cysteine desulfhydrase family protein [bacterium]|nr:MAG: D-cysteine desulfhydrase family protein [bacterium]
MLDRYFKLGFFPTPIERLENLSKVFNGYNIFIKRDDLTGLATGGNKTRKLEYLLYDALNNGYDTVITAGAYQSNHCRQTAAACRKARLECYLVLGGEAEPEPDGNLLLDILLGANIHYTTRSRRGEKMDEIADGLRKQGKKVYIIPYGGSNATGMIGYVRAMVELKEQIDEMGIEFHYIFIPTSSGGTQSGMLLGEEITGLKSRIIGINIDKEETYGIPLEDYIMKLIEEGADKLRIKAHVSKEDVIVVREYDSAGYGVLTENERKAIKLLAETEGILLDPVYTGRGFFGMIDMLEKGMLEKGTNILFWHTGGTPAIFHYGKSLL